MLATVLALAGGVAVAAVLAVRAARSEELARWEQYRTAVSAAGMAVANRDVAVARRHLDSTDPRLRNWEYRHLSTRLDQSVAVYSPGIEGGFQVLPGSGERMGAFLTIPAGEGEMEWHEPGTGHRTAGIDPRLADWYRCLTARPEVGTPVVDGVLYTPSADGGEPIACRLRGWTPKPGSRVVRGEVARHAPTLALLVRSGVGDSVVIVSLETQMCVEHRLIEGERATRLAISGDGTVVAVAMPRVGVRSPSIRVLDARTGGERSSIAPLAQEVMGLALDQDGRRLVATLLNGQAGLWDIMVEPAVDLASRFSQWCDHPVYSSDGTLLALGGRDGVVRLWEAATLESRLSLPGHTGSVLGVEFEADGPGLISNSMDGTVRRWRLGGFQEEPRRIGFELQPVALALAGRAGLVAVANEGGAVDVWNVADGSRAGLFQARGTLDGLSFSRDGARRRCRMSFSFGLGLWESSSWLCRRRESGWHRREGTER